MTTPLRPLTTGELLDATFTLYRRHFLLFVGLIALPYVLLLPLQVFNVMLSRGTFEFSYQILLVWFVMMIVTLVVTAASQGATVIAVSDVYLGRPATIMGSLSRMRGQIGAVIVMMIAMGAAITVGLILLVVPGVILALMWSLAVPVLVLEGQPIRDALTRSAELTKGFRGRILLIYFLFFVMTFVVGFLLGVPAAIAGVVMTLRAGSPGAAGLTLPGWVDAVNIVTSFLTHCLVGPLLTIAIAVLYYDVRVRKEAFDLQLMMTTLDGTPGAAPDGQAGA